MSLARVNDKRIDETTHCVPNAVLTAVHKVTLCRPGPHHRSFVLIGFRSRTTVGGQPPALPARSEDPPVTRVLAGRGQPEHPDRPDAVGPLRIAGVAGVKVDGEAEQPVARRALDLTRHEPPTWRPDVQLIPDGRSGRAL